MHGSSNDYELESTECQGTSSEVITNTRCEILLTTLAAAPWNLQLDESIWAQVVAMNDYGDSAPSPAGNGGVTKLVPDAPINLLNDGLVTSDLSIRFTW